MFFGKPKCEHEDESFCVLCLECKDCCRCENSLGFADLISVNGIGTEEDHGQERREENRKKREKEKLYKYHQG